MSDYSNTRDAISLLEFYIERNNLTVLYSNNNFEPLAYNQDVVIFTAKNGDISTINILIDAGVSLNAQNNIGYSALMWACIKGNTDIALTLVKAGANLDLQDQSGYSTLMWAIDKGHTDIVPNLLAYGSDLNLQDESDYNALMVAIIQGHADIALTLVKAGANLDMQNEGGRSALMLAIIHGHTDVAIALIENGANIELQDQSGFTALAASAAQNNLEIYNILIKKITDAGLESININKAVLCASYVGDKKNIEVMLDKGAKLHINYRSGKNPIMLAIENNKMEFADYLVQLIINKLKDSADALEKAQDTNSLNNIQILNKKDILELINCYINSPSKYISKIEQDEDFDENDIKEAKELIDKYNSLYACKIEEKIKKYVCDYHDKIQSAGDKQIDSEPESIYNPWIEEESIDVEYNFTSAADGSESNEEHEIDLAGGDFADSN